jgi:enterochelin esterase-like enzyme
VVPRSLGRREFFPLVGALLCAAQACRRETQTASTTTTPSATPTNAPLPPPTASVAPEPAREGLRILDWSFAPDLGTSFEAAFARRALIILPDPIPDGVKLPVLVALHGMGETTDPTTGANGWLKSYELDIAIRNLKKPPVDEDAYRGFVTQSRLDEVNAALAKQPYQGLIIACPYLPRAINAEVTYDDYARFLGTALLPRIHKELPSMNTLKSTGIDGVSLGGISALSIGLMRGDLFGAVGALQPAIFDAPQADRIADDVAKKLAGRPLRITTSEGDVYKDALVVFDQKLTQRKIPHEFSIYPGPHDYIWNKGPGAMEMLFWHDRILRT